MALSHQIGRDATAVKAHARAAAAIPQAATDGCDGCMCESCISRIPCDFALGCHMVAEFLRDLVAREVITLAHLPGKVMIADLLTKAPVCV